MALTHGAASGYRNGCRCDPCRAAHAARSVGERQRRAELLAADPSLIMHGTWNGYNNWSCRCELCNQANAERNHEHWLRRRALRNARRHGQVS